MKDPKKCALLSNCGWSYLRDTCHEKGVAVCEKIPLKKACDLNPLCRYDGTACVSAEAAACLSATEEEECKTTLGCSVGKSCPSAGEASFLQLAAAPKPSKAALQEARSPTPMVPSIETTWIYKERKLAIKKAEAEEKAAALGLNILSSASESGSDSGSGSGSSPLIVTDDGVPMLKDIHEHEGGVTKVVEEHRWPKQVHQELFEESALCTALRFKFAQMCVIIGGLPHLMDYHATQEKCGPRPLPPPPMISHFSH